MRKIALSHALLEVGQRNDVPQHSSRSSTRQLDHSEDEQQHYCRRGRDQKRLQAAHPATEKKHGLCFQVGKWGAGKCRRATSGSLLEPVDGRSGPIIGRPVDVNVMIVAALETKQTGKAKQPEQAPRKIVIVLAFWLDGLGQRDVVGSRKRGWPHRIHAVGIGRIAQIRVGRRRRILGEDRGRRKRDGARQ